MGCNQSAVVEKVAGESPIGADNSNKAINDEERITKRYKLKKTLGIGNFSTVKRGIKRDNGQEFAIKILDKITLPADELQMARKEASILLRTNHPNIIKMIETFETSTKVYIILEILKGKSLFDRIAKYGAFSELQASKIIGSVASSVQHLHQNGVAHRDLKPENLLFVDNSRDSVIKLTDFGLSAYFGLGAAKEKMTLSCGSPSYVAPEVLSGNPYDEQIDMWSLGVILYIMLCGYCPFNGKDAKELYHNILTCNFSFPTSQWEHISHEAKHLVSNLIIVDPIKRFTSEKVLAHPFVTQIPGKGESGETSSGSFIDF